MTLNAPNTGCLKMMNLSNIFLDPIYSIVLTIGFLGSGHCIGMCGPMVAALSLSKPGREHGIYFHLLYNGGRITTYTLIGIAAGWIGSLLTGSKTFTLLSEILLISADILVIIIGIRTTGMFKKLAFIHLELPGSVGLLTRGITRLQRLPAVTAAFPVGLLMGFLPCGFLYTIALAAVGRGSAVKGGLIMLLFGLGTLPSLFLFGSAVQWMSAKIRAELLRWAGFMVVCVGIYNLFRHIS